MKESFFKNKRVLITGHTGFKGSWLTLWLDQLGADITGFSLNPPSNPYHYKFLELENKIADVHGDIRKAEDVAKAVRDYEPQMIFHLAAHPILLSSYSDPVDTYMTNTIGSLNVLEAARKFGNVRSFVNVTTDKVYANIGKMDAYKEGEPLGSNDPYSSSKACSELITQTYRQSFLSDTGVTTARAGNVMGGGDWGKYRVIPDLVQSYVHKKEIEIRHPDAIRPWTHVFDILNGYLTLGEMAYERPKEYSGPWNFASGVVKTVEDLVKEFSNHWSIRYRIGKAKLHEDKLLLLNSDKSRKRLKWKPLLDFETSVKMTVDWYAYFYNNTRDKKPISRYSLLQLNNFRNNLRKNSA